MPDQSFSDTPLTPESARGVCRKILAGATFKAAPRLSRLLEACVEAHATTSRPALDAEDRGELKRLRRKLEDYYAAEGASDPVRLDLTLPDGAVRFETKDSSIDLAAWAATAAAKVEAEAAAPSRRKRRLAAILIIVLSGSLFALFRASSDVDPGDVHTVAILPIDDGRPIQLHDTLVPGITSALTIQLSYVGKWSTVSHPSVLQFAYNERTTAALRSELNADIVVEGKLTPTEKTIEGELSMRRTSDGRRVWHRAFTASRDNLLPAIDQAAQDISTRLGATLPAYALLTPKAANGAKPLSREAVEGYLSAIADTKITPGEMQTDLRALEAAIEAEPKFSAAHNALAAIWAHILQLEYRPAKEAATKCREVAAAALALEPNSAEAHLALGVAHALGDWNWAEARKELNRALELRPSYTYAMSRLGQIEETNGNAKAAVEILEKARALNPADQSLNVDLGFAYVFNRQYDKAHSVMAHLEKIDPEYNVIRLVRGMAYLGNKEYDRTLSQLDKLTKIRAWTPPSAAIAAPAAAFSGKTEEARKLLAELRDKDSFGTPDPVVLAGILLALGEDKEGYQLLNQAAVAHKSLLLTLPVNPIFDRYRNDPRFREVVAKLNASR